MFMNIWMIGKNSIKLKISVNDSIIINWKRRFLQSLKYGRYHDAD